jgi:hypothetical protein
VQISGKATDTGLTVAISPARVVSTVSVISAETTSNRFACVAYAQERLNEAKVFAMPTKTFLRIALIGSGKKDWCSCPVLDPSHSTLEQLCKRAGFHLLMDAGL